MRTYAIQFVMMSGTFPNSKSLKVGWKGKTRVRKVPFTGGNKVRNIEVQSKEY